MKRNLNKNVMSKIAGITKDKVELKSEVVELGLVDEMKGALKYIANDNKKIQNQYDKLEAAIRKANDENQMLKAIAGGVDQNVKSYYKRIEDIKKAAKDLGVNPSEIKGFNDFVKEVKEIDDFSDFAKIQSKEPIG
tara:strand:+ start:103 stop:510 length:408 start_codon:yes stop_codon:yes gene_type:complete